MSAPGPAERPGIPGEPPCGTHPQPPTHGRFCPKRRLNPTKLPELNFRVRERREGSDATGRTRLESMQTRRWAPQLTWLLQVVAGGNLGWGGGDA